MKKIFSFVAALLFAGSMMAGVAEIKFTEAVEADSLAENASFTAAGSAFAATITDPDNKMSIDANDCRFGDAEGYNMYNFRLKTGGKSSSTKNFITLNIPEAGTLCLAVRTGSNSATDRNLVIKQGEAELYNQAIVETMAIDVTEGEATVKVYPFVQVAVEAGEVILSYPTNGLNFYALVLITEDVVPAVPQYEVAEAIAAGLADDTEILVRGVITKMEIKGKNFAKYGSVNIYVADATGAEGEFEFYNCYALDADTFRTTTPAYDATSTAWAQLTEAVDGNGNAVHVGDTVIALGKYKLYNSTHELNTGCYLVDVKHAPVAPADTIKLDFNTENTTYAFVDNKYFSEYGSTDIYLSDININASTYEFEGDGNYLVLDFYPENANNVTGVYQAQDETLDLEYTYMLTINGTDTAVVEFVDGAIQVEIGEVNKEYGMAQLALAGQLISTEGDIYAITALVIAYYDFLPEEGVEDVVIDPKAIKSIVNGQVVIEKAGKTYNVNGTVIR